ncbi:MAG: hypothetical protein OEY23_26590, partial [Acidimicrobiia bacterium]|nr:hypothetical protein [Acidimicrobiia bacterium]
PGTAGPDGTAATTATTAETVVPRVEVAPSLLTRAAEGAAAAQTGRFDMVLSVPGGPMPIETKASGVFDETNGRAFVTMSMPPLGSFEVLVDGDTTYLHLPQDPSLGEASGRWVTSGAATGQSSIGSMTDPGEFLAMLEALGSGVESLGDESLDGTTVTHYRAAVSVAEMLRTLDSAQAAELQAQFALAGTSSAVFERWKWTVELWVDAGGTLRRMRLEMDLSDLGLGAAGPMTMDLMLHDLGLPVDMPPAPLDALDGTAFGF